MWIKRAYFSYQLNIWGTIIAWMEIFQTITLRNRKLDSAPTVNPSPCVGDHEWRNDLPSGATFVGILVTMQIYFTRLIYFIYLPDYVGSMVHTVVELYVISAGIKLVQCISISDGDDNYPELYVKSFQNCLEKKKSNCYSQGRDGKSYNQHENHNVSPCHCLSCYQLRTINTKLCAACCSWRNHSCDAGSEKLWVLCYWLNVKKYYWRSCRWDKCDTIGLLNPSSILNQAGCINLKSNSDMKLIIRIYEFWLVSKVNSIQLRLYNKCLPRRPIALIGGIVTLFCFSTCSSVLGFRIFERNPSFGKKLWEKWGINRSLFNHQTQGVMIDSISTLLAVLAVF